MNKRGQSLSTGAIVLIILGVIVLVVLALGFTLGWNKLLPWLSQGDNVQNVVTQCSTYCSLGSTYDYCSRSMTITANKVDYPGTCDSFAKSTNATIKSFGVATCSGITCQS